MPELTPSEAKQLYRQRSELPLFYQPAWLDAVCGAEHWQVALVLDGAGQIQAALPYWPQRRFGLRLITHPPLTPRMGPWLIYPEQELKQNSQYDFEEKTIHALLAQLPKVVFCRIKCHPRLQNWYPFYQAGFRQTTAYTYLLDLQKPAELWPKLEAATRNKIRKGKQQLHVEPGADIDLVHALLKSNTGGRKQQGYLSQALLKSIDRALAPAQQRDIYFAKDASGQIVGACYIAYDMDTAYNLILTTNDAGRQKGAAAFLLWHAILQAARRVPQFDFEGSMLPGVERFFRGFGGELVGYHVLERW